MIESCTDNARPKMAHHSPRKSVHPTSLARRPHPSRERASSPARSTLNSRIVGCCLSSLVSRPRCHPPVVLLAWLFRPRQASRCQNSHESRTAKENRLRRVNCKWASVSRIILKWTYNAQDHVGDGSSQTEASPDGQVQWIVLVPSLYH